MRRKRGLVNKRGLQDGPVTRVPNEVWEMIRYELVQEEMEDSEDALIGPLFCDDPTCDTRPPVRDQVRWSKTLDIPNPWCEDCLESLREWGDEEISCWSETTVKNLKDITSQFGLALPFASPIVRDYILESLASHLGLIAAPARFKEGSIDGSIVSAKCGGYEPDDHTIADVSFKLPSDIHQRFVRFIRFFNFQIIDSSVNTLVHESEDTAKPKGTKKLRASSANGVKAEVTTKIDPSWRLWLTCEGFW
ncbi:uncharacterized protein JCM6883_004438 [Sporobolomyces salmoneus]|uniref:uncharacterized protein n=1 Tax=Sporobolomyces salmoneus TaxID=183962 RepID=UPI00317899BD